MAQYSYSSVKLVKNHFYEKTYETEGKKQVFFFYLWVDFAAHFLKHPVPVWGPEMCLPNSPDYRIWPMILATAYVPIM